MYVGVCVCVCVNVACTSPPPKKKYSTPVHPLQHGVLQVSDEYTQAVEGVVLHNRVDPLTTGGHHTC